MTSLENIRSTVSSVLGKNMAIARNQGTIVSTSVSSQELSGNGGEYENTETDYTVQKKRRLNVDKAKVLEKYFEMDSKLEPQRKMQLSQMLDIQPRQVAVWFQNRRARSKAKTLQTDYDALRLSYLNLKSDYQGLLQENHNLMSELEILKKKLWSIGQDVYDEEIESAEKEITKTISSFENPTSARDSTSTAEDVWDVQPFYYNGGVRSEDNNSDHLPYRGYPYPRVDEQAPSSLKVLPDHLVGWAARTTEEGALCGRFTNPSLRLDESFLHCEEHNCFPNVEDQANVGLSWWGGWP